MKELTDLEITRLVAEAMGLTVVEQLGGMRFPNTQAEDSVYDPLHDKAQCFELIERFNIHISAPELPVLTQWVASCHITPDRADNAYARDAELKRAVCLCVVMQQQKRGE